MVEKLEVSPAPDFLSKDHLSRKNVKQLEICTSPKT
jgi:hypothetical protein